LENAAKFTHEGTITLQAKTIDGLVSFIVEDTGISIPADESEHIFEEFVQLNEFADGTGIGLTVARSVALRLGGDLRVDTDYKQGARFIFELLRY
jgi:signal transduction histidine kinase